MTSVVTVKKQIENMKQKLMLKPKHRTKIVVRMWLPDDDPRHNMTDTEIEKSQEDSVIVLKPLKRIHHDV